jgi:ribosomal protein S12 methylthiotransferase accessory factor
MSGALGEAIEAHASETWWQPDFKKDWEQLETSDRSGSAGDWWVAPDSHAGISIDWTIVEALVGKPLAVPTLAINNDFTRARPAGLIASSAGQAAGESRDKARVAGLLELIERDAFRALQEADGFQSSAMQLTWHEIRDSKAGSFATALVEKGFTTTFFSLPAVIAVPVVACMLRDLRAGSDAPQFVVGSAARLDPDAALNAALLEAAQVRATWISGSRDDLTDTSDADTESALTGAMPLPPGISTSARLPAPCINDDSLSWLVARLVDAGFTRVASARLDAPDLGVAVEKLFVPGLRPMRVA